jgi:hypothetical protein
MTDETKTVHEDNDTPTASDEGIARFDADTPGQGDANPGASLNQGVRIDSPEENNDPKSGGTPVHAAPTEDSPNS